MKAIALLFFLSIPSLCYGQQFSTPLQQGIYHYEMQEYDAAISSFDRALHLPDPPRDVYRYLISSHLLNGQPGQAAEAALRGLEEYPDDLALNVMRGEALIQTDTRQAIAVFEEVLGVFQHSGDSEIQGIRLADIRQYLSQLYQKSAAEAFQEERLQQAAGEYGKALALDPGGENVHSNLAYILIQLKEWEEAERVLEEALNNFPDHENLLFMQAQVWQHQGEYARLTDVLEILYEADPSNMERAVLYGNALLQTNQADRANLFFMEKIREYPGQRTLYRALADMNRQRFNQSGLLEVLRLKKDQFPDDRGIAEEYGRELIASQKYEEAYVYFDSLAVAYHDPGYARLSAHALLFDSRTEQAEEVYENYLAQWPEEDILLEEYGIVLKYNGSTREAGDVFRRYLNRTENSRMRIHYAQLLDSCRAKEEALQQVAGTPYKGWADWLLMETCHAEGSAEASSYTRTLLDMMRLYEILQDEVQKEAQAGLNTLRANQPPLFQKAADLEEVRSELREMLDIISKQFSFGEAADILDRALNQFADSVLLLHHKALLYYHQKQFHEALEYFGQVVQLNANSEEAHFGLGRTSQQLNQFEHAILSYERTIAINNRHREAYQALIQLHQAEGELGSLCDRWLQRYRHEKENEFLKEFLIEALHKAGRFEDARELTNHSG